MLIFVETCILIGISLLLYVMGKYAVKVLKAILQYNMGELGYNKFIARLQNIQIRQLGSGKYYIRRGWIKLDTLYDSSVYDSPHYVWGKYRTTFSTIDKVGKVYHEHVLKDINCSVEVFVEKIVDGRIEK